MKLTRKQRKAKKILSEFTSVDFNNLKGHRKHKRTYHKDFKATQDYYTKTLNMWFETKDNRYINEVIY